MLKLPGKTEEKDLLKEETERMLDIMQEHRIDSREYALAFARFKELHAEQLEEKKLKEMQKARWFDAIATGGLAIMTMSYEYWAPLTTKWANTIARPFKHGLKPSFRQPK